MFTNAVVADRVVVDVMAVLHCIDWVACSCHYYCFFVCRKLDVFYDKSGTEFTPGAGKD